MKRATPSAAITPAKNVIEELKELSRTFREVANSYVARIEREIEEVQRDVQTWAAEESALTAKRKGKPPAAAEDEAVQGRVRDLRDMLILLRSLQVQPEKGRRKDLKKIDGIVGDLRLFTENWTRG